MPPGETITVENEQAVEAQGTDRLILFSDAVVAIAITLLALELPVPVGPDAAALWDSAREHADHYLAFLISFYAIAAAWGQHHRIFRSVVRNDSLLRKLNMLWLLMIILNPFATRLLVTEGGDTLTAHALRWGFYAFLQVLAGLTLIGITHHLNVRGLRADGARSPLAAEPQRYAILVGFALSIPVFFATTTAWLLWIAVPLLTSYVYLPLRDRRRGRTRGGGDHGSGRIG
ncbi:TMEM175 family protein [Streptomyces griseoviridis]